MGNLVSLCDSFVERSLSDTWAATTGSYSTLMALNALCALVATVQLVLLPTKSLWSRHRVFLKLVLVGCCIGIAASYFRMQQVYNGIASSNAQGNLLYLKLDAQSDWNGALFYLLTPWETSCLLFAKLLVLERMGTFAMRFKMNDASFVSRLIASDSRQKFLGVIIALLVASISAYTVGASFYFQSSSLKLDVLARNLSDAAVIASVFVDVSDIYGKSSICLSVHDFSECVMFLIIICAFCFVGFHIKMRIQSMLGKLPDTSYKSARNALMQGAALNRRITTAVSTIFFSFFLRFIWTLVNAIAGLSPRNKSCELECADCQSSGYLISKILFVGGELRAVLFMLSNPLSLLVSVIVMHPQQPRAEEPIPSSAALLSRDTEAILERRPRGTFDGRVLFGSGEYSPS
jgi:hypothetical protein